MMNLNGCFIYNLHFGKIFFYPVYIASRLEKYSFKYALNRKIFYDVNCMCLYNLLFVIIAVCG